MRCSYMKTPFDVPKLIRSNLRQARLHWPSFLTPRAIQMLKGYTEGFHFSVSVGDLVLLDRSWYVTHTGLLGLARRKRCSGIHIEVVDSLCDSGANRFVLKATVFPSKGSSGFVGCGAADPSNVSSLVRGAEMRVAETRAVNRALRKAYGIGLCSVEELGWSSRPSKPTPEPTHRNEHQNGNGSTNGQPRLRDQLCLLIREHNLDPTLVKAYAADFCGTQTIKEASRDLVESRS